MDKIKPKLLRVEEAINARLLNEKNESIIIKKSGVKKKWKS